MAIAGGGPFGEAIAILQGLGAKSGSGSGASGFFNPNNPVMQILLYNVIGQAIAPLLAPFVQVETNFMNARLSEVPISPAEAALGVLRGDLTDAQALGEAEMSGINEQRFGWMKLNTGEPISPEQALFLLRRQKIDQATLERAIRQSRVRDEWIPAILDLVTQPMSPADAVAAAVQNQMPLADAQQKAYEGGLEPADFTVLYNTRGRPPGPAELLELVRRGVIPQTGTGPGVLSLDQGISESDIKDKWIPAYHALLEYIPPPRTVTALLHAGSIDQATALQLFRDAGLSQELAAAYVANASHTKVATEKTLAKSTVVQLYTDKLIPAAEATQMLEQLGYTAADSGFILQLADLSAHLTSFRTAITRIGSLFVSRKIETPQASSALDALGVAPAQRDQLLTTWELERGASLRILNDSTVAMAWKYGMIPDDEALADLVALGYTVHDAWIYLGAHNKGQGPASPMPPRDQIHGSLE